jgi:hypothetical protein
VPGTPSRLALCAWTVPAAPDMSRIAMNGIRTTVFL